METSSCAAAVVKSPDDLRRLSDLLHQALAIEYCFIVDCTRLAAMVADARQVKLVDLLGRSSLEHAQVAGRLVQELGCGEQRLYLDPFPEGLGLRKILQLQLEKEKLARWVYERCGELVETSELKARMGEMVAAEEGHLMIVEELLAAVPP